MGWIQSFISEKCLIFFFFNESGALISSWDLKTKQEQTVFTPLPCPAARNVPRCPLTDQMETKKKKRDETEAIYRCKA